MTTTLRVLLLEDSADDAELVILRLVADGFRPNWRRVETEKEYLAALDPPPDLILADWSLPHFSGRRALLLVRELHLDVPFIVVSGSIGEVAAVEAMQGGAYDYVFKDDLARLGPAVHHALAEKELRDGRKRAEEELRRSEKAHRELIENLNDVVFALDPGGRVSYASPAVERLLGYTPSEMIGELYEPFLHPDDRGAVRVALHDVLGGRLYPSEFRFRAKTGEYRWVRTSSRPLLGDHGGVVGLTGLLTDIDDQRRAEEALRKSQADLARAQGIAHLGSWEWNVKENSLAWSDELYRVFGLPRDAELTFDGIVARMHPDDRERNQAFVERILSTSGSDDVEFRIVTPLGEVRHIYQRAEARRGPDGHADVVFGTMQDVTERKRAEEALARERDLLTNLLVNTTDHIYFKDRSSRFTRINPAQARWLGLADAEQATGKTDADFFSAPHAEQALADERLVMATGEPLVAVEEEETWPDGHSTWVSTTKVPIRDATGQIAGLVGISRDVTERKRDEHALRTSESFLNSVIEQSPYPMWISDDKGLLLRLNQACRSLLRITDEEVVGKYNILEDSIVREQGLVPLVRRVYESGDTVRFEIDYDSARLEALTLAESAHVLLATTVFPLRDANGRITNAVIQHVDATERRRAEEQARASEERFRSLYENSTIGLYRTTPDGRILMANPAAVRMLGFASFEDLAERSLEQEGFAPNHSRGEFRARLERDGVVSGLETAWTRKDGSTVFVRESARVVRDEAGRSLYFDGTFEDISEKRHAQEAHRASEQRFRAVFEAATDGILLAEVESGDFVMANPAICAMLGYTEDELLQLGVKDIHPPEELPVVRRTFLAQASGGPTLAPGITVRRKDGSTFFADVNSMSLMLGEKRCLVGMFRDMTAFHELEDQMRQAQKMEAVGRLAGGVAHDFNNLLGIILGHCDLARKDVREDDPLARNLGQIQASAERAAALTRQLLAFSRKQALQPRVLELNVIMSGLAAMLRRLIGEDVELTTVLSDDLGRVLADPGQIEQVIVNLAVNARDAMPQGGRLVIETRNIELDEGYARHHATAAPGHYVMLAVSDTGVGMDEKTKSRIFEPFFTTKDLGKGTGLGLSTVYGIVNQSGGHIWVYSEVGQGTTFKVYLPRTDGTPDGPVRPHGGAAQRGRGESILVVEDEAGLRDIVRELLEDLGYRPTVASNGGEALLAVEEGNLRPVLLMTDLVMPEMGGATLVRRLRRRLPELKVLYMSGYTDAVVLAHLEPDAPFLQKPFKISDLAAAIASLLGRRSVDADGAAEDEGSGP